MPNFGSPEAQASGAGWFHLDVPRHLVHFTPASLDSCLREAGLEPLESSWFAPEFDAFSFVQSTLNAMGLRQNALYDVLRGRAAKLGKGGGATAAGSVALAAPLGILSVPATLVASLAGGRLEAHRARAARVSTGQFRRIAAALAGSSASRRAIASATPCRSPRAERATARFAQMRGSEGRSAAARSSAAAARRCSPRFPWAVPRLYQASA